MKNEIEDWTEIKDGYIHVPDELDPLINKIGMQIGFLKFSGKNETETICHIAYIAQKFFHEIYTKNHITK